MYQHYIARHGIARAAYQLDTTRSVGLIRNGQQKAERKSDRGRGKDAPAHDILAGFKVRSRGDGSIRFDLGVVVYAQGQQ